MSPASRALHSGFLRSAAAFADRPALEVAGRSLTYRALREQATALARALARASEGGGPSLTAVLAARSETAYAGILASLFRGHGYVPLNPTQPAARTRSMLRRSGCASVIADEAGEARLEEILEGLEGAVVVVLPHRDDTRELAGRWPGHRFLGSGALEEAGAWEPARTDPESSAYLLFTSGSTGTPKGVTVAHRNVTAFVDVMVERYGVNEHDRFSQVFDLTFDLSAFDMFVCWERGACLCVPTDGEVVAPRRYVIDSRLSVWFSVPSTAVLMKRFRMLEPGSFPDLRLSLFCGEALPVEIAGAWSEAAPRSAVENLYGPTELTIACTLYRWDPERTPAESENGIVPIGEALPGMSALVVDEALDAVPDGEVGELLMTGPQLTLGYWKDSERTAGAFVVPPGRAQTYYRTGDRVRRRKGGGPLVYLGRLDHQIKVRGFRVELGEVEAVLREEAAVDVAVALGWPRMETGAEGIVAFLEAPATAVEKVRERLRGRLPAYMVPRRIHVLDELPRNSNGKVDRRALTALLDEGTLA